MSSTGSMRFRDRPSEPKEDARTYAGLVLVHSLRFEAIPPAYLFKQKEIVIGREEGDLLVADGSVSARHARFIYDDHRHWIEDAGSRHGTFLDGVRVDRALVLPMQEIRMGNAIFKYVPSGAESHLPYRIDGARVGPGGVVESPPDWTKPILGGYTIHRLLRALDKLASSTIPVVLRGESGTGKELAAKYLHDASGRSGPFVAINCGAISSGVVEAELFGAKRGAYSGAYADRPGFFRAANGGTLLLDEIGDMPLEAQVKLLRVLQNSEVTPVGASLPEPIDVRVICATHRDLGELVRANLFRADLLARLQGFTIELPPLRDRKEDIYGLCLALLERLSRTELTLSLPFLSGLLHYDYPLNVRELHAMLLAAVTLCEGKELLGENLPTEVEAAMVGYGEREAVTTVPEIKPEEPLVDGLVMNEAELCSLLLRYAGNVAAVARALGRGRATIYRWMQYWEISATDFR